ncbi:MAG TPA: serine/threonine-protein kinase [Ktedonobacteraceae bacterium]|nr:serine/threonine-protein kinase [Ktedonobacteraceae bacterium]
MVSSYYECDICGTDNRANAKYCKCCGNELPLLLPLNHLLKQHYRIIGMLGKGNFGKVYKAEDTLLSNRPVAVKEMNQDGLSKHKLAEAINDFKREAHLLARLPHPNLPSIYEHFEEAKRWYLVMDYINGETLEMYLDKTNQKRLPEKEVINIGIQLCTVLAYLHTQPQPIIFRDLKPANIMRTSDGHLYLIDFGIARHFKPGQAKDTVALGSPGYAAPEQYGKVQTTSRSDIYSLGAVLHHLLSGKDPSTTPFQFPSLKSLVPSISPELDIYIKQMLDMDINNRPASMADIKKKLESIASQLATVLPITVPTTVAPITAQIALQASPVPAPQSTIQKHHIQPASPNAISFPIGTTLSIHHIPVQLAENISLSPDWKYVAAAVFDHNPFCGVREHDRVEIWEVATEKLIHTLDYHFYQAHRIEWSPDCRHIAVIIGQNSHRDAGIDIIDVTSGSKVLEYIGHGSPMYQWRGRVEELDWSPDGKYIASSGCGKVLLWETATGKTIYQARSADKQTSQALWSSGLAWSPDGNYICSWGSNRGPGFSEAHYDGTVWIWETATRKNLFVYSNPSNKFYSVVWSPDGKYIAFSSEEKKIQILNAHSGIQLLSYQGYSPLAWSPNGNYIASESNDSAIHIWDASTGKDKYIYRGHNKSIRKITWSPDGSRIASVDFDKTLYTIRIWQAK